MTYFVNKTDGTAIVIPDGTKDTSSTSLTLLGKLSSNYGEDQNENFVRLLENFAFAISPSNPVTGQLWYDSANSVLKVYNATTSAWKSVGQDVQGNVEITANLVIGPQGFEIQEIAGNVNLINRSINGNISIFSNVAGTSTRVLNIDATTGLITVSANASNNLGITTKSYVDSFVNSLTSNAASQASSINTLNNNLNLLQSNVSTLSSDLNLLESNVLTLSSAVTSLSSGTESLNSKDISLNGNIVLQNSGTGNVAIDIKTPGGVTVLSAEGASDSATPVTIKGQWVLGTNASLEANYADLAENFASDVDYEPGTVLVFGGSSEVTQSITENDTKVAGVVTTDPAFVMNHKLVGTKSCIALQGRVPCKVIGPVQLGDMLVTSAVPGHAKKAVNPVLGSVIGKALQNYDSEHPGIIEIVAGVV
jgi:hypothetical protein